MGEEYLMDSNAISDYLGAKYPTNGMELMHGIVNQIPQISVISRIELLGFVSPISPKIKSFVEYSTIFELDEPIILKTIALRRSRSVKIPDAIIAATALVRNLTLITHNTLDFKGITNLNLIDPYLV